MENCPGWSFYEEGWMQLVDIKDAGKSGVRWGWMKFSLCHYLLCRIVCWWDYFIVTIGGWRDHWYWGYVVKQFFGMLNSHLVKMGCIFKKYFSYQNKIHPHYTRSANNISYPCFRLSSSQEHVLFSGQKIWNAMPAYLIEIKELNNFKHKFKLLLHSKYK